MTGRIWFEGNPWPAGHALKALHWTARLKDDGLWMDLHLETTDYYADSEGNEGETDWTAPIVWGNYHACTLSTTHWHIGGFKVATPFDFAAGLKVHVDPLDSPTLLEEWGRAFHVYLLGHDAVADHHIAITPDGRVDWTGKIALFYAGETEFKHSFRVAAGGVFLERIDLEHRFGEREAREWLAEVLTNAPAYRWDASANAFLRT